MEGEALGLASQLTLKSGRRGRPLMPRVRDNGRALVRSYRALAPVVRERATVPPAAQWLVDNFHVVESALRLVRSDLSRAFYRDLPKLAAGPFAGFPRVLAIMDAFIGHTDGRVEMAELRAFLVAFQRIEPLTIGELWAIPIALRVTLLEKLRRLADRIADGPEADSAADVMVRNLITSLRALGSFQAAPFFESVSLVDEALRDGSHFEAMDFPSRDRYRHAIEDLSRGSGLSELEVTRRALQRAAAAPGATAELGLPATRQGDPGYYLISDGRTVFEREIGYRPRLGRRLMRAYVSTATVSYLGTIAIVTAFLLALPLVSARAAGMAPIWLVLLGLAAAVVASDLAIALVNRAVMELLGPRRLPRLALADGVPPSLRTMVVVPTLLANEADIAEQVSALEIHYLANPTGDLYFAILSDWTDAPTETTPRDEALLAAARDGIARLNARHPGPDGTTRFFLLHRRRLWNAARACGWAGSASAASCRN